MKPQEMMSMISALEKIILHLKNKDTVTKYKTLTLFKEIRKLIEYQVPEPPINVSEDGHKFECPKCHAKFDSEDTADDFYLCYLCGKRWKEEEVDEHDTEEGYGSTV